MSRQSGSVKIEFGDSRHPKVLLKELKQKKKILHKVLKGKFSHLTEEEAETYKNMTRDEIYNMIKSYDKRIIDLRKGLWSQGYVASRNEREMRRAGWTAYRNSGMFAGPRMDAVRTSENVMEQEKKESEDL